MRFCPQCANMLLIDAGSADMTHRFVCQSCPYVHVIQKTVVHKIPLERKQVDDVLGGADAWKNVDSTEATCPKCEHDRAYYKQIQIRSADEPSSIFYLCCRCTFQWREG